LHQNGGMGTPARQPAAARPSGRVKRAAAFGID
jgi:hypothetical protein